MNEAKLQGQRRTGDLARGKIIVIILFAVFLQQIAQGGTALENYLDHGGLPAESGTLTSRSCTLPAPVYSELLSEVESGQSSLLLGYLAQTASTDSGDRTYMAKRMIVLVLYFSAQSDKMSALRQIKPKEDFKIYLSIPRLFCQAVESGFPQDPKLWRDWYNQVVPQPARFRKGAEEPLIWVINIRDASVSEALEHIGKESGVKVHYSAPKSGDDKITLRAANISASEAFQDVARLANLNVSYKEDGVHFTPKQ